VAAGSLSLDEKPHRTVDLRMVNAFGPEKAMKTLKINALPAGWHARGY
jgi:hypothetical protein